MGKEEDFSYYRQLLDEDSAAKPLNYSEKSSIITQCMQEAENQRQRIIRRFGLREPEYYIEKLGYEIVEEEAEFMPSFLYMGIMEPDQKLVRLNLKVIRLGMAYMETRLYGEREQREKFRQIILFHELFHVIEEETPGIYTRGVRAERLSGRFRRFLRGRRIETASEIGAIHFSKQMAGADFSPCRYREYLLAAVSDAGAGIAEGAASGGTQPNE